MDKSVCCYLVVVHKESRERLLEEFDVSLPKQLARAASPGTFIRTGGEMARHVRLRQDGKSGVSCRRSVRTFRNSILVQYMLAKAYNDSRCVER